MANRASSSDRSADDSTVLVLHSPMVKAGGKKARLEIEEIGFLSTVRFLLRGALIDDCKMPTFEPEPKRTLIRVDLGGVELANFSGLRALVKWLWHMEIVFPSASFLIENCPPALEANLASLYGFFPKKTVFKGMAR